MGGTSSPLAWTLGYDPLIEGLTEATGVAAPTFVDDLAALTYGPRQTYHVLYFLMAASRAAGLQLETHRCRGLLADPLPEVLRQALDRLTLGISQCEDGRISITGLPLVLLVALARSLGQEAWTRTVTEFVGLCRCKVKTAIVPSRNLQGWKLRLAHTPFGTEALVRHWKYLGAELGGPAPREEFRNRWQATALEALRFATWQAPCRKLRLRTRHIADTQASPEMRCQLRNVYAASFIPYPVQDALPKVS